MQMPGLIVAPLTPFTPDLRLNEPALQRQIDYILRPIQSSKFSMAVTPLVPLRRNRQNRHARLCILAPPILDDHRKAI